LALVGISVTIEEYVRLWIFFKQKKTLQVLWIEKEGFTCRSHISLHNNLGNMFFLYVFPTSTKDMKGTKFMPSILKELYPNLLSDFKSKCGLWFFLNFCRVSIEQGACIWKDGKEMIKPSCVHAPPPVHDMVRCLLFFSGGVAHPHTSLELYLLFIQRQK